MSATTRWRAAAGALLLLLGAHSGVARAQAPAPAPAPATSRDPATGPPGVDPTAPAVGVPAPVPGDLSPVPELDAAGAVLWDADEGVVLAGRAAELGRPMASTTKIMTVLLALEALEAGSVAESLTVSARAAEIGRIPGAASLGLREGQTVPVRDLLAALLLRSGNGGAVAVAEHVAGSEAAFVERMNARAAELGLSDTHFVNATGLTDDPAHRAAPLDLVRLGALAMTHPDFARWAGSDTLTLPAFGTLDNRNELVGVYPGITGIKTGFTDLAGQCLVASATRDGRTLYAVVLGSDDRVGDTTALLDYGFEEFARPEAISAGATATAYRWGQAEVPLVARDTLAQTVAAGTTVAWRTALVPRPALPIIAGEVLGRAELVADGTVTRAVDLIAAGSTPADGGTGSVGTAVVDALRTFQRLAPVDRILATAPQGQDPN